MTKTYATITVDDDEVRIWPAEKFEISELVVALKSVIQSVDIRTIMDREELGKVATLSIDPVLNGFIAVAILNTMAKDGWEALGFPIGMTLDLWSRDTPLGTIWLVKTLEVLA